MKNNKELILPYELPGTLGSLSKHEQEICDKSVFEIKKSVELSDHLDIIHESLEVLYFLSHDYRNQTDDELTIQCLGTRIFNSAVSSLKMLLSGYYQSSLMFQRDIIETQFLLDFLTIERPDGQSEISAWKNCTNQERQNRYRPKKIRTALDKRDGFKHKNREARYHEFSEYATHPSYPGFELLAPDGLVKIGPFFHLPSLADLLKVSARHTLGAAIVLDCHFPLKKLSLGVPKKLAWHYLEGLLDFIDNVDTWADKYWETSLSRGGTDEIRAEIAKLKADDPD